MVGADHGIVDHLQHVRHGPASIQCLHDILPEPGQRPAPELPVDARPLAEFFRQVTPWSTRPSYPEDPIKNKPVVDGFASVRGADSQDETLKDRPFLVGLQVSCQAGLRRRYHLESRLPPNVNLFCEHSLIDK